MIEKIQAFIYLDETGKEVRVPLDAFDYEIDMNPMDQLQGILKAIRYILGTQEGDSVLAQAVTVHRRYAMSWPDFKRLNVLQHLEGGQVCRTYVGGGEVLWWNLSRHEHPTLREALDKLIKLSETDHVTVETRTGRIPSTDPGKIEFIPDDLPGGNSSDVNAIAERKRETSEIEIRPESRTD